MVVKKSKNKVCGEHWMDSFATTELIRKVDEYKKKGINVSRKQDGSRIEVCVSSKNKNEFQNVVNDLGQHQVRWNHLKEEFKGNPTKILTDEQIAKIRKRQDEEYSHR